MNKNLQRKIFLTITNPGKLAPGSSAHKSFDQLGGTIGSRGSNWILQDSSSRVNTIHCEIKWIDGAFCVVDRCGDTRLNNNSEGIGAGHVAKLNAGDILGIGPFLVEVYFDELQNDLPDPTKSLGQHSIHELLGKNTDRITDSQRADENVANLTSTVDHETLKKREFDYMSAQNHPPKTEVDPLAALEHEQNHDVKHAYSMPLDPKHYGYSTAGKTQPNYSETAHEVVTQGQGYQATQPTHIASHEWHSAYAQAGTEGQYLAGVPLQQGLQTNLGSMDSNATYALLLEVGKSLKATVEGIKKLYGDETSGSGRLQMLTRTLQPIEDNPLRLEQSYEDTIRSMFSEYKSAVHLSASSAIEESLEQARVHNIAIIRAISESLNALLKAFSPDVLKDRFTRYNTQYEGQQSEDSWTWTMYNHYYNELTSSRQQGFEKLFWEVFEQAYDRAMREISK